MIKIYTFIYLTFYFSLQIANAQCNNCSSNLPINNGLVACYPFNGNANDESGNVFNGNIIGAGSDSDRFDNPNSAFSFNGTNQYIRLGDILDSVFARNPISQFSISGWAKTNTLTAFAGGGIIIGKLSGGGTNGYQWAINHDNDGKVRAVVAKLNATNFIEVQSTSVIPVNNWFHFVLTFDGNQIETNSVNIFVDTIQGNTYRDIGTLGTRTINTDQELTIGAGHAFGNPSQLNNQYNGTIDDIKIYNRVLTFTDISELYNCTNLTSGLSSLNSISKTILIYPNPVNDFLYLDTEIRYSVYNITGNLILIGSGSTINVSELKNGIYYISGYDSKGHLINTKFSK